MRAEPTVVLTMIRLRLAAQYTIALPFGTGRTPPVAVDDVALVVATVLRDPAPHIRHVYQASQRHGHVGVQAPRAAVAWPVSTGSTVARTGELSSTDRGYVYRIVPTTAGHSPLLGGTK